MGYKTYGFYIEGINVDSTTGMPAMFGASLIESSIQYVSVGLNNHKWIKDVCIGFPSMSTSKIDPLKGTLTAGSVKLDITANDEMSRLFMNTAISRNNVAVLASKLELLDTTVVFEQALLGALPQFLYLNEEVIEVLSLDSGTTYNIARAKGQTLRREHLAGSYLYNKPPFWIGRAINIVVFDLPDRLTLPVTPTGAKIVWSGFIDAQPQAVSGTSKITLSAANTIDVLRKITVNNSPVRNNDGEQTIGTRFINGKVVLAGSIRVPPFESTVMKFPTWADTGRYTANQVGNSLTLTKAGSLLDPHIPGTAVVLGYNVLGSPLFKLDETYDTPFWEVLVWSKDIDIILDSRQPGDAISPTIECLYPYHPLTVAAALLFSTDGEASDPLSYDVLHPNWSAQVAYLSNIDAWENLIEETSSFEIDQLVLGWNGEPVDIWKLITEQLLPAFGFQLTEDANHNLIPIRVGVADVEKYLNAPVISPLPEYWEWTPSQSSALDVIYAKIGEMPWGNGVNVTVSGQGVKTTSSRTTRLINPKDTSVDWPFFKSGSAQTLGLTTIQERLAFRYDGIPVVKLRINGVSSPYLGQFIRLQKPDGLLTDILFDIDGERVDDWLSVPFLCQVISARPIIQQGYWEIEGLLTNYSFQTYAKYRAPACRIKSRTGTGTYLIEGTTSDFGTTKTDAEFFTVGDQVYLYGPSLNVKATGTKTVTSVVPSGADWLITIDSDFSSVGAADDWLQLSDSDVYSNGNVVGAEEPYPYTFMTDSLVLNRPGSTTTDPDIYA